MSIQKVAKGQTLGTFTLIDVDSIEVYSLNSSSAQTCYRGVAERLLKNKLSDKESFMNDVELKPETAGTVFEKGVSPSGTGYDGADVIPSPVTIASNCPGPVDPPRPEAEEGADGTEDCTVEVDSEGGVRKSCPDHLRVTLSGADLTVAHYNEAVQLLNEFQDVFVGPDGKVGYTDMVRHRIDTGDVPPRKQAVRRMEPAQRDILDSELDKILATEKCFL